MSKNITLSRKFNMQFGVGTSDSWGFSLEYCRYTKSLAVMIVHWYAYIEAWIEKDAEEDKDDD